VGTAAIVGEWAVTSLRPATLIEDSVVPDTLSRVLGTTSRPDEGVGRGTVSTTVDRLRSAETVFTFDAEREEPIRPNRTNTVPGRRGDNFICRYISTKDNRFRGVLFWRRIFVPCYKIPTEGR
jgi:hypothetical protein